MNKKQKQYILFINASKDKALDVFLLDKNLIIDKISQIGNYKISEYLLLNINKLLKKNKIDLKHIKGLITISGPGPFTSIRIAAAVTNTLAYSLNITGVGIKTSQLSSNEELIKLGLKSLNRAKKGNQIQPFYNQPPNINKAKV